MDIRALVFTLVLVSPVAIAEEIQRDQVADLMAECQQQRQEKIAPLKADAIDKCINEQRRGEDYCNRYHSTYGEGGATAAGGRKSGMFWDLPVCEQALAADRYFKMNPGKASYKP